MNHKSLSPALRPLLLGLSLSILLVAKAGAAGIGHEVSDAAKAGGADFGHEVADNAKATDAGRGNGDDVVEPGLPSDPGVPAMLFLSKNNGGDDLPPPPEEPVE